MKKLGLISLLIFLGLYSFAQEDSHAEVGLFAGGTYYIGELNPESQFINSPRPVFGVFFKKNLNKRYALNFNFNYGWIEAHDELAGHDFNEFRNLSFNTNIMDFSGLLEFNFFPYMIGDDQYPPLTPYIFGGLTVFRVVPEVENHYTNSSSKGSQLIAPAFPFGAGVKFDIVRNLGGTVQWGFRKTFTDEFDGINDTYAFGYQKGFIQNNDWYSFAGLTLNYKILTKNDRCTGVIN